jgi:hypothetical protein
MSRTVLPLYSSDISALAKSLREQLLAHESTPSHLELLNMLARASGQRNFQALRAQAVAQNAITNPEPAPEPEAVDYVRVKRLLRFFDAQGRLIRWPGKLSQRLPCLWVIWSRLPAKQVLSEKQVKERLGEMHLFGDHALLRRWLCDHGLVKRTTDGREYCRVEMQPPAEALALIRHLGQGPGPGASPERS